MFLIFGHLIDERSGAGKLFRLSLDKRLTRQLRSDLPQLHQPLVVLFASLEDAVVVGFQFIVGFGRYADDLLPLRVRTKNLAVLNIANKTGLHRAVSGIKGL